MGTNFVVVSSPLLDRTFRVVDREEPVQVQALARSVPLKLSMKPFWTGLPG